MTARNCTNPSGHGCSDRRAAGASESGTSVPFFVRRNVEHTWCGCSADVRWLRYMRGALDEIGIPEDAKRRIDAFLTHTGYFMQNVDDQGGRIY